MSLFWFIFYESHGTKMTKSCVLPAALCNTSEVYPPVSLDGSDVFQADAFRWCAGSDCLTLFHFVESPYRVIMSYDLVFIRPRRRLMWCFGSRSPVSWDGFVGCLQADALRRCCAGSDCLRSSSGVIMAKSSYVLPATLNDTSSISSVPLSAAEWDWKDIFQVEVLGGVLCFG